MLFAMASSGKGMQAAFVTIILCAVGQYTTFAQPGANPVSSAAAFVNPDRCEPLPDSAIANLKSGKCPVFKRPFCPAGWCQGGCKDDALCPGNRKCCFNGCTYSCQTPVLPRRLGTCPAVPPSPLCAAGDVCRYDVDCIDDTQKCCQNGCGNTTCQTPLIWHGKSAIVTQTCPAYEATVCNAWAYKCTQDHGDADCPEQQKCCAGSDCAYKCVDMVLTIPAYLAKNDNGGTIADLST